MKFSAQLCAVLFVLRQPLIIAIEFVDDCRHLGGPIFAEKDGWARIGCKSDNKNAASLIVLDMMVLVLRPNQTVL